MKKLKNSLSARCIALLLAVISGTAAAAGCMIVLFTLQLNLYQQPLDTAISRQQENMQYWYSAKLFSKMESIAKSNDASITNQDYDAIRTGLQDYLNTENLEFGIIHADTLQGIDLSKKKNYIYENFQTTVPDDSSTSVNYHFTEIYSCDPGNAPKLVESLITSYKFLLYEDREFYESSIKPENSYWIISNVKNPLNNSTGSDIFAQQEELLTSLYRYRYTSVILTLFFVIVFLMTTAFCCYSAGNNPDGEHPRVTWKHKTPPLLYVLFCLGITGSCAYLAAFLIATLLSGSLSLGFVSILCTFLTVAGILSTVLMLMNLSVRIHAGIFWEHTMLWHLWHLVHHIHEIYRNYTSLFIRGGMAIIAVNLMELLISISLYNSSGDLLLIFWVLVKSLEFLIGFPLLLQMKRLQDGSRQLASGNLENKIDTHYMFPDLRKHADYLNQISDGMSIALQERLKSEHFKTELITNVSHDIKTPLTSLINYVDLLQKENITEEDQKEYLAVLERQSARLKKLIEDLIEASKASTGNLEVNRESCDIQILLTQTIGEFEEKLHANELELLTRTPDTPVTIQADNRHLWRIFDNLMNNICKYSQPGTRVYIDLETTDNSTVRIIFRNTSRYALNLSGTDLTERFIRGDVSRHTEGNGLGLSIALSLAESMDGTLTIHTDGDLFKVIVAFPC